MPANIHRVCPWEGLLIPEDQSMCKDMWKFVTSTNHRILKANCSIAKLY